ncbi:hypothetical protein FALBO_6086 [Fusarium albosuccineum]|uniref:Uncharacterized protein n=1 Tax=Fusarium albosuccineum TaxID=1237068 RepID=A0A8H4LDM5_9HYPO|nr:hypothetical protein FALBO_6086 [Fusarium albosuccineum]
MAFRLPAQEDTAGTYLESLPYLSSLINLRLAKGQPEGETARIWDDILHNVFPGKDNYSTGPEMLMGAGRADLFTAHLVLDTRFQEKKFLIVECKASGLETQNDIWATGVEQLEQYLGSISGHHRKFGALAVGKCVRFYEWKDGVLHDMADGEIFYLDRQCRTVMRHLVYFRENHG